MPLAKLRVDPIGKPMLHLKSADDRLDRAAELDDCAVARGLDHCPAVLGHCGSCNLGHERMHGREGTNLVLLHHARRADDIGDKNGGEAAGQPFRVIG